MQPDVQIGSVVVTTTSGIGSPRETRKVVGETKTLWIVNFLWMDSKGDITNSFTKKFRKKNLIALGNSKWYWHRIIDVNNSLSHINKSTE